MLIDFNAMETTVMERFYGGEGALEAKMFRDEQNKILKGTLQSGSNIGLHTHDATSEIIFILSGKGYVLCDGEITRLAAGDCHYCRMGSEHCLVNDGAEALVFYAVVPMH